MERPARLASSQKQIRKIEIPKVFIKDADTRAKRNTLEEDTKPPGSVKIEPDMNQDTVKVDRKLLGSGKQNTSTTAPFSGFPCGEVDKANGLAEEASRKPRPKVTRRMSSTIRQIQEKIRKEQLKDMNRCNFKEGQQQDYYAVAMNAVAVVKNARRQRSKSRTKHGKIKCDQLQRPYRRWLGVSTCVASDTRFIVGPVKSNTRSKMVEACKNNNETNDELQSCSRNSHTPSPHTNHNCVTETGKPDFEQCVDESSDPSVGSDVSNHSCRESKSEEHESHSDNSLSQQNSSSSNAARKRRKLKQRKKRLRFRDSESFQTTECLLKLDVESETTETTIKPVVIEPVEIASKEFTFDESNNENHPFEPEEMATHYVSETNPTQFRDENGALSTPEISQNFVATNDTEAFGESVSQLEHQDMGGDYITSQSPALKDECDLSKHEVPPQSKEERAETDSMTLQVITNVQCDMSTVENSNEPQERENKENTTLLQYTVNHQCSPVKSLSPSQPIKDSVITDKTMTPLNNDQADESEKDTPSEFSPLFESRGTEKDSITEELSLQYNEGENVIETIAAELFYQFDDERTENEFLASELLLQSEELKNEKDPISAELSGNIGMGINGKKYVTAELSVLSEEEETGQGPIEIELALQSEEEQIGMKPITAEFSPRLEEKDAELENTHVELPPQPEEYMSEKESVANEFSFQQEKESENEPIEAELLLELQPEGEETEEKLTIPEVSHPTEEEVEECIAAELSLQRKEEAAEENPIVLVPEFSLQLKEESEKEPIVESENEVSLPLEENKEPITAKLSLQQKEDEVDENPIVADLFLQEEDEESKVQQSATAELPLQPEKERTGMETAVAELLATIEPEEIKCENDEPVTTAGFPVRVDNEGEEVRIDGKNMLYCETTPALIKEESKNDCTVSRKCLTNELGNLQTLVGSCLLSENDKMENEESSIPVISSPPNAQSLHTVNDQGGLAGTAVGEAKYEFMPPPATEPDMPPKAGDTVPKLGALLAGNSLRQEIRTFGDRELFNAGGYNSKKVSKFRALSKKLKPRGKMEFISVLAIKDCSGTLPGQLAFKKGQTIKQLDTGLKDVDGMFYGYYRVGRLRRKVWGIYPSSHVSIFFDSDDDEGGKDTQSDPKCSSRPI